MGNACASKSVEVTAVEAKAPSPPPRKPSLKNHPKSGDDQTLQRTSSSGRQISFRADAFPERQPSGRSPAAQRPQQVAIEESDDDDDNDDDDDDDDQEVKQLRRSFSSPTGAGASEAAREVRESQPYRVQRSASCRASDTEALVQHLRPRGKNVLRRGISAKESSPRELLRRASGKPISGSRLRSSGASKWQSFEPAHIRLDAQNKELARNTIREALREHFMFHSLSEVRMLLIARSHNSHAAAERCRHRMQPAPTHERWHAASRMRPGTDRGHD
jgi:hypothetical protein